MYSIFLNQFFNSNRLTTKLVAGILLFSSTITLLLTLAQVSGKYFSGTKEISRGLQLITSRHNDTISRSLWTIDKQQLDIELKAIVFLKYVQMIRVYDEKGQLFASNGSGVLEERYVYKSDLIYGEEKQVIGRVEVYGTENYLLASIWSSLAETIILNLTKTILVSMFLFIFFHNTVLRRLNKLHLAIRKMPVNSKDKEYIHYDKGSDELDELIKKFLSVSKSLNLAWSESEKKQKALEQANRIKSSFLEMVSHELRTPLNTIINSAALRRSIPGISQEEEQVYSTVEQSGIHMLRLINDMIDFVSYQKEVPVIKKERIALDDVFQSISDSFNAKAKTKGLTLTFSAHPTPFPILHFDRIRLSQILFNLLENALRFTKEGGISLTVDIFDKKEAIVRKLPIDEQERWVRFSVLDTGSGIEPENLEKINTPFYQLQGSIRRTHGGLGLGLSIVQRLVSALKGSLVVESIVGQGSRFDVLLPVGLDNIELEANPLRKSEFALPNPSPKSHATSILLVDDDDSARKIGSMLLNRLGFTNITQASGGVEAIDKLNDHHFDIILLDIQMPDIDGWQVAKSYASKTRSRSKSKVIALTAMNEQQFWEKSEEGSFDFLLNKPVKAKALKQTILCLSGERSSLQYS